MAENRITDNFEKASQEFFKETWEFSWTLIGALSMLVLTGFGVYFSQVALSEVIGQAGLMLYFTWCASIAISALEVAGIKLLGDKNRSQSISTSNKAEHGVAKWFTYGLFSFDIFTNWTGLYITAQKLMVVVEGEIPKTIGLGGWIVIVFFGSLMAISEILVGWMIRAVATSYVSFLQARKKFETYKEAMEKNNNFSDTRNDSSKSNSVQTQTQNNSQRNNDEGNSSSRLSIPNMKVSDPTFHKITYQNPNTRNGNEGRKESTYDA